VNISAGDGLAPFRVAYLVSHPIQYQVPLLRRLAADPALDLTVYYMDDMGARQYYDWEFGSTVQWDLPLLDGYTWRVLRNRSPISADHFLRFFHPSVFGTLRAGRYDALIVHGYAHATEWLSFLGAWTTSTPLFLRGESNLLGRRRWWVRTGKRAVLGGLLHRIHGALAIGERNREFYLAYGVPDDRIFSVPYAVDNEYFMTEAARLRPERAALREHLGVPPGVPVVLYAGKLIPRKRPLDLVQAAARIAGECPLSLVLMGDGSERALLEAEIARAGLRHALITGFINQGEISQYYAASDVLVLPSSHEPWGLVLNEAMCFGMPAIASDAVGAAPDLVRPGENGYVYPVGDVDALAQALRGVLCDPARRDAMGARSREIVAAYSFEADVRGILDALRSSGVRRAAPVPAGARASR